MTARDPIGETTRWLLAPLLAAHGAIHVLGFLWAFELAEIDQLGGPTLLIGGAAPGDPEIVAFGGLWLVSMLAFMVAGIGVAMGKAWGLPAAGIASGISLVPTVVWWNDAWIGAVLSAAILIVVIAVRSGRDRGVPIARPLGAG